MRQNTQKTRHRHCQATAAVVARNSGKEFAGKQKTLLAEHMLTKRDCGTAVEQESDKCQAKSYYGR